jgi:ankyrin repeat protein
MQTPTTKQLIAAIKKDDIAAVTQLLEAGADPNARETRYTLPSLRTRDRGGKPYPGDTPLIVAVSYRNIPIAELLLKRGANANGQGLYRRTALLEALNMLEPELTQLLLAHKANPNLADNRGEVPLVAAASHPDSVKHIELLLRAGADPNGGSGMTPLQAAAEIWESGNVRTLLRGGARVNFRRPGFGTALYYAERYASRIPKESASLREAASLLRKAGGKSLPPIPIKEKRPEPTSQPPKPTLRPMPRDQELTDDDQEVLNLALEHFLTYEGRDLRLTKRTRLLLVETSSGYSLFDDNQLNADLEMEQALQVTLPLREHLQQRNLTRVSLRAWKPHRAEIELWEAKKLVTVFGQYGQKLPHGHVRLSVCLPGYTPNKENAVLRVRFSEGFHGVSGTYFLKKSQSQWELAWHEFSFYV